MLSRGDEGAAAALFAVLTVAGTVTALAATLVFDVAGAGAVARAAALVTAVSLGPLVLGVVLRARRPAFAAALARWLSRLGALLLVAVVIALARAHGGDLAGTGTLGASVVLLALSALPALALAARGRRIAATQVALVKNLTLALVVLAAVGAPPAAVGAVLSFGLVMYVIAAGFAILVRVRS
jgi:BASS family bile acid:Na+ symporter